MSALASLQTQPGLQRRSRSRVLPGAPHGDFEIAGGDLQVAGSLATLPFETTTEGAQMLKIELNLQINFVTVLAVLSFIVTVGGLVYAILS